MLRISLDVETEQPVVLARSHLSGNIVHSLDYIPGSTIRGAMAARFVQKRGKPENNWDKFKKYFCSDTVRFENLYIAEGVNFVSPIPLSSKTCKAYNGFLNDDVKAGPYDGVSDYLLTDTDNMPESCPRCQRDRQQETPIEGIPGFYSVPFKPRYDLTRRTDVRKGYSIHNEIEDETQRTKEGVLYTLEHIGEEQKFNGSIIFADEQTRENFQRDVIGENGEFTLYVGQARSRGVGKIKIKVGGAFDDFSFDQGFFPPVEERFNSFAENRFSITLYSDAILVDKYLSYLTSLPPICLSKALQVELTSVRTFSSYHTVSGWYSGAGLPKEDDVAITKGSAFLFRYNESSDRVKLVEGLKTLEEEGIGLRRNEGFGRVVVCDSYHLKMNELKGK